MGIEPTWDSYEPHTDFEDQGHHQEPVTSNRTRLPFTQMGWQRTAASNADQHSFYIGSAAFRTPL